MSSDIQQKRNALRALYGETWRLAVNNMPDHQVVAVYLRFKKEGKIK